MRASTLLLALPVAASAQQFAILDQVKGFFSKATDSISAAVASATQPITVPNPAASIAAKIAELNVQKITLDNHKDVLKAGGATASPGFEPWLVYVTGGNKTCFGLCGPAETAWNESIPLISVSPNAPNLGLLNCETDGVLCHAWALAPPRLLHILLPQPLADQSAPGATFRTIDVNRTTVTAPEIASLILQEKYLETAPYEGVWHPFDGLLAKANLNIPIGYVIWGAAQIPSWAFMILVSFASRTFMGRRMPQSGAQAGAAPRPAAAT